MPACCPRNRAMHSALPQVRPEPSRRLPHGQDGSRRASHAAYASSSAVPPLPGTETTGRMRPPGRASHSRGLSAAGLPGMGPIVQSSLLRNLPDPFPRGAGERLHDRRPGSPANHADQSSQPGNRAPLPAEPGRPPGFDGDQLPRPTVIRPDGRPCPSRSVAASILAADPVRRAGTWSGLPPCG